MSLAVWSIAILHGFFVLLIYGLTNSKTGVIAAAIFSAIIGIFTGNPVYILIDILCVVGATLYCLDDLENSNKKTPEEIKKQNEKKRLQRIKAEEDSRNFDKAFNKFLQISIVVIIIGGILFFKLQPSPNQAHINQNINQQQNNIQEATKPKITPAKIITPNKKTPPKERKTTPSPKKSPIESCLKIHDENAMVRCLEAT